jgi:small-conductance mechanosensitive channel
MFVKSLNNQFYGNLLDTAIVFVIISLIYFLFRIFLFRIFLLRRLSEDKMKKKVSARLNYVFILFFLMFIAKIWIEGFTHFFYALSLVSAGLVVTNKETIMNFVGWIVITWRGLFAEGDYIKLGDNSGFVYELGVLYFKVLQSSENFTKNISGKMIKIPNGLIITTPLINFSLNSNLVETTQTWIFTPESDMKFALDFLQKQTEKVLLEYYENNKQYSLRHVKPIIAKRINLDVNIKVAIQLEKPAGLKLTICYYCFPQDKDILDKTLLLSLYTALQQQNVIKIAYMN